MRPAADSETCGQVRAALQLAARRGADPVVALNNLGLIDSPGRQLYTAADTLRRAGIQLGAMSLRQMAQAAGVRMPTSPLDAQRLIEAWLLSQADEVGKQS